MPDDGQTVRVVLADDHPVVRDGLRALLTSLGTVDIVGEAATGREAVRLAVTLHPDVLVMDLQMPDVGGVEATRQISKAAPGVAVLILTMFEDHDNVDAAMRAGARGYLVKGASQQQIAQAISTISVGGAVLGPQAAARVLSRLTNTVVVQPTFPQLTDREREVLDFVAAGLPNPAIAGRMSLSVKTVGNHISSIFAKLPAADRSAAIVMARDAGLGHST